MSETIIILLVTVGIPVLSVTLIILKAMDNRKERREERDRGALSQDELKEIYYGLQDMNRRMGNLETILYQKKSERDSQGPRGGKI